MKPVPIASLRSIGSWDARNRQMSEDNQILTLYSLSDSTGQTAETLSKAAIRQFRHAQEIKYVPLPRITRQEQIDKIIKIMEQSRPCMIAYTLSIPALKEYIDQQAALFKIPIVNLLDPLIQTISKQLGITPPRNERGMMHELDEEYFKRIEAVEFAIKLDDGKD